MWQAEHRKLHEKARNALITQPNHYLQISFSPSGELGGDGRLTAVTTESGIFPGICALVGDHEEQQGGFGAVDSEEAKKTSFFKAF